MATTYTAETIFEFDDFSLYTGQRRLFKGGEKVDLAACRAENLDDGE
jgi:hypothetical protein